MIETKKQYEAWVVNLGQQEEMPPEVQLIEVLCNATRAAKEIVRTAKGDSKFPMDAHVPAIRINMLQNALDALPAWILEDE